MVKSGNGGARGLSFLRRRAKEPADSPVGMVEVTDFVIWLKHIQGAPDLRDGLRNLQQEELVQLDMRERSGQWVQTHWVRMKDDRNGRPTFGLKPGDSRTRDFWRGLFRDKRGELVHIRLMPPSR